MYEGPSVAFKPQGPKGPWSSSEYSGKLPSPPPPLSEIVPLRLWLILCLIYWLIDWFIYLSVCGLLDWTVEELLSSSEHLGVMAAETVALRRCVEHVSEWRQRVQTALTNDSIAQVHRLITTKTADQEKPTATSDETSAPTEQADPPPSLQTSPEFGKNCLITTLLLEIC